MTQTLKAFAVTLSFKEGPLLLNTLIAPDAAAASAATMLELCRKGVPEQPLQGVVAAEVQTDWLRWALRTIESGVSHAAPVVSLVQPPERPQQREITMAERLAAEANPNGFGPNYSPSPGYSNPHLMPTEAPEPA